MKRNIFLLIPLAFSLFSCSSGKSVEENYVVERGSLLLDQRIYKVSPIWSASHCDQIEIGIDWRFSSSVLLFSADCPLSSQELKSLPKDVVDFSGLEFQQEKYACDGTSYYSYTPTVSREMMSVTIDSERYSGMIALFYSCSLQEYIVTPKDGGNSFSLYLQASSVFLTVENM